MSDPLPNVFADRFAVLMGEIDCFKCHLKTPVAALVVPDHHDDPIDFDGSEDGDRGDLSLERCLDPALLGNITWIDTEALHAIQHIAPWMAWIASATADQVYLGNGCTHCGALQGDWFLRKPDGPFFPMTDEAADKLVVSWQPMPLRAVASCGYSSWISDFLERRGDYIAPQSKQMRGKRKTKR